MSDELFANDSVLDKVGTGAIGVCFMALGLWCLSDPKSVQKKHFEKIKSAHVSNQPNSLRPIPLPAIQIFGGLCFIMGLIMVYSKWFG